MLGEIRTPRKCTFYFVRMSVEEGQFVEYHPLSSLSPAAPIEFAISGATSEYLDLSNTYLHVRAKVTKADRTNLDAGTDVPRVN